MKYEELSEDSDIEIKLEKIKDRTNNHGRQIQEMTRLLKYVIQNNLSEEQYNELCKKYNLGNFEK